MGEPYCNKYCYIVELDADRRITALRVYLDALYAQQVFEVTQQAPDAINWRE